MQLLFSSAGVIAGVSAPSVIKAGHPKIADRLRMDARLALLLAALSSASGASRRVSTVSELNNALGEESVDDITLNAGTYLLTATIGSSSCATADLTVCGIAKDLRLAAASGQEGQVLLDGQGARRILQVRTGGDVSLHGLHIRNGKAPLTPAGTQESGGAVILFGGRLAVSSCTLTACQAKYGGVFSTIVSAANSDVVLTVSGSVVSSSSASIAGGCFYISNSCLAPACTVSGSMVNVVVTDSLVTDCKIVLAPPSSPDYAEDVGEGHGQTHCTNRRAPSTRCTADLVHRVWLQARVAPSV